MDRETKQHWRTRRARQSLSDERPSRKAEVELVGLKTEEEPEGRRSPTKPKKWRDEAQPISPEVRDGGRAMTDRGRAGGTREPCGAGRTIFQVGP